jgi:hypothetical protein
MTSTTSEPADLTGRLDAMLHALRSSSRVRVFEATQRPLAPENSSLNVVVDNLAEFAEVSTHGALRKCWHTFERFSVHWEATDIAKDENHGVVGGELSLVYLFDVASRGTDLLSERSTSEEQALLRSLRVIDDQPAGGNGTLAAVRLIDKQLTPDVWFFDVRSGVHELDIDYCGYLDALITTKGGYGWQYLYADIDLSKAEQRLLRERLSRLLAFLTSTFPDVDYGVLQHRLETRTTRRDRTRR